MCGESKNMRRKQGREGQRENSSKKKKEKLEGLSGDKQFGGVRERCLEIQDDQNLTQTAKEGKKGRPRIRREERKR